MLKASQLNVLEDRTITDKGQWAEAVAMLEETLKTHVKVLLTSFGIVQTKSKVASPSHVKYSIFKVTEFFVSTVP